MSFFFVFKNKVAYFFIQLYYSVVSFALHSLTRRTIVQAVYFHHFYSDLSLSLMLEDEIFLAPNILNQALFSSVISRHFFLLSSYPLLFSSLSLEQDLFSVISLVVFKAFLAEFSLNLIDKKILFKEYLVLLDQFSPFEASNIKIFMNKVSDDFFAKFDFSGSKDGSFDHSQQVFDRKIHGILNEEVQFENPFANIIANIKQKESENQLKNPFSDVAKEMGDQGGSSNIGTDMIKEVSTKHCENVCEVEKRDFDILERSSEKVSDDEVENSVNIDID